ncbi:MAG: Type 4 prepilin-like protein leader peptide-processing enzyme [Pseudomonadota bacterium]|jgi:leader peptidase (prepilin peptidase)/N-methyltransferase
MNDQLVWVLAALLGLIFGSFLNVVIYRLPRMVLRDQAQAEAPALSLSFPRSHCPHCGHTLSAWELVPVLSFIYLRGQCRQCHTSISWAYPLTELLNAALWVLCVVHFGSTPQGWSAAIYASALLTLARIDLQTTLLPDAITLPLLWMGLAASSLGWTNTSLNDAVWGTMLGYTLFWVLDGVYLKLRGRHGLGGGDAKLLAAMLAWLGWPALVSLLLLASLSALLVVLVQWLRGRLQAQAEIPFGPYLALAGLVLLVYKPLPWL